jgi:GlcNAc-P-P-Und epimerase
MKLLVTGGSGFIGRNLIEYMAGQGHQLFNLDIKEAPEGQPATFSRCDILDAPAVKLCFQRFQPEAVVHLAARVNLAQSGPVEPYYASVTRGTQNVLDAVKSTPSVGRVIVTSTQYVCRPGYQARGLDDYNPHTVYGEAKALMEKLTKAANLSCVWTLIRPVIIWGPWNFFYRDTLLRAMIKGYYFHPSGRSAMLDFGYIRNSVRQIEQLLRADPTLVDKKTFYLGDGLFPLVDWMNGFCQELTGHQIRRLPRGLIRALAWFGDGYEAVTGRKFIMYTFRYRNMTDDYIVPLEPLLELLGPSEISMAQGIKETVTWARQHPGR